MLISVLRMPAGIGHGRDAIRIVMETGIMAGLGIFVIYIREYEMPSLEDRIGIWKDGWKYYKQHWIFGYGLGHWKLVTKQLHAHNDFFQVLFEMGVGSWILISGYLIDVYKRFTREALIPTVALIVILVHSSYSWLWCVGTTAIIQVTWLAILQIHLRHREKVQFVHLFPGC